MKLRKGSALVAASAALVIAVAATYGQAGGDRRDADNGASPKKTSFVVLQDAKKKSKKLRGRLPNYYGKVGVTKTQRTKIYELQASYNEKIAALVQQIADLKAKRDMEVEAVLKPEQKKKVEELREAARKKREARKKKKEKSDAE